VQGDRTMGIYEKPSKKFLQAIENQFDFTPPKEPGYDVVEAIHAMYHKKGKVFVCMGGNFLSATPDTNYTADAMRNCELTVQISTKLNRSHLIHGKEALILPTLGRTDTDETKGKKQFVTVENSMGIVHASKGTLQPPSKFVESEPVIVANIAKATLKNSKVDWDFLVSDYNNIRDLIEKTIIVFDNYNEKIKNPIGFELPNGARVGDFNTPNKKANFTINRLRNEEKLADEFIMMTIRSHDQFNTTIYGLNDRYRGVYNGRMVVFMNEQDMLKKGLKKGDKVTLFNNYNHKKREVSNFTVVPYNIPKGCVATYFPEANPLVPLELIAHTSYTPSSKSVCVKII
jgi:molybdopterin-dependent oxidoreductase alpha subunit